MIDDAIKIGKRVGHVSMITEIPLSPKRGPDVYVNNVQNRLSIYLYARLLWDPDQSMADILRDWCQTVFGNAAGPMVDFAQSSCRVPEFGGSAADARMKTQMGADRWEVQITIPFASLGYTPNPNES